MSKASRASGGSNFIASLKTASDRSMGCPPLLTANATACASGGSCFIASLITRPETFLPRAMSLVIWSAGRNARLAAIEMGAASIAI